MILFSGHMVDDPAVRGEGKEKPARFPAAKTEAAATRIAAALDEIGAGPGDLGIRGENCGGDLLFAEACSPAACGLAAAGPGCEPVLRDPSPSPTLTAGGAGVRPCDRAAGGSW